MTRPNGTREPLELLAEHLTQCAVEYLACVNGGDLTWQVREPNGTPEGYRETYTVDEDVVDGPVVMVRASDGLRVEVDVMVSVSMAREGR